MYKKEGVWLAVWVKSIGLQLGKTYGSTRRVKPMVCRMCKTYGLTRRVKSVVCRICKVHTPLSVQPTLKNMGG